MKKSWKRLISVLLSVMMIAALAVPAFAYDLGKSEVKGVQWEKISENLFTDALKRKGLTTVESKPEFADTDVVRVSIMLASPSVIEMGYPTENIAANADAMQYRGTLQDKQEALTAAISAKALGGEKLDVVWNLTLAANIISANVPYGKIEAIKSVPGVKNVILETRYEPEKSEKSDEPNMSIASDMTGGSYAWASGYTGAGSKVAIIDTGLDTDHQSFSSEAFDHAIAEIEEKTGKQVSLLTAEDVAAVLPQLHAAERYEGLTAEDLYLGTKVPFAFNYVDKDLDVTHDNDSQEEHGSHVAGIAAANRFIKTEEGFENALEYVKTQGEAPDAQIIVMKVFGKGGGAFDSDYFAAVEDAIILGCDSVNLSLGSGATGLVTEDEAYQKIMDNLTDTSLVMVCSGGNQYSWQWFTLLEGAAGQGYLYADDVNMGRTGSPGSLTNSLTVASVDNDGVTGTYLVYDDTMIFYSESATYGNAPIATIGGQEFDFIYIDSTGTAEEFEAVADVLEGKIAICNRGDISFYVKANNAVANGAVATIIANNQDGSIAMNLTGYEYDKPAVLISLADANYIKANAELVEGEGISYYTGKIFISESTGSLNYGSYYYTMSDFSSWGINGNLELKPEITAPGGNIYSVNGLPQETDQYESMSGTSMAAPQITGLAAVLAQYLRENGLLEKTGLTTRQLTNSLLMSTAKPLVEEEAGMYYSVLKQGAGLVRIDEAIRAKTFILMDESSTASAKDGKVKAEIGETDGEFSVKFTINNFTDKDVETDISALFFTQDMFTYYTLTPDGQGALADEEGDPLYSDYLDTWTTILEYDLVWKLDGEEVVFSDDEKLVAAYDIDGDEIWDKYDALALLAYITGETDELENLYLADVNADGKIDTLDVYELLKALMAATATVPANGSLEVEVDVTLDPDFFAELCYTGNYVEGYIFVYERPDANEEDEWFGVEHSIPVVGFYGRWSDPSMFDKGSLLSFIYGYEYRTPYMAYVYGEDAYSLQAFSAYNEELDLQYAFGGNPLEWDDDYLFERDAVNADTLMDFVQYTQIRNGGATRVRVYADDEVVYEEITGPSYASYYYVNGQEWRNTVTQTDIGFKAGDLPEGTELLYELTIAPEYYVAEDGSVDWDALGFGTSMYAFATVDNTDPQIDDLSIGYVKSLNDFGMSVKASDNNYIAGVMLMAYDDGELVTLGYIPADPDAEAGDDFEKFLPLDLYEKDEDGNVILAYPYLYAAVFDYALNSSTYKINLNTSEFADPELDILTDEEIMIIGNGSRQIGYTLFPWGIEEIEDVKMTFASSDESIAVVDENGVVTSVADDTSSAVITVTATLGEKTCSVECTVNILFLDVTLNAAIWDENGEVWFSEFDIMRLPDYTKLTEEKAPAMIGAVAIDNYGYMFGATTDKDDSSELYLIDEDYSMMKIGESSVPFFDIAPAPALGDFMFLAVYGPYIFVVDMTKGDYVAYFDMSNFVNGNNIVGIAFEERYVYDDYGDTNWYFFVDSKGNFYETGFLLYGDGISRFDVNNLGNVGYETDSYRYNSLYFDGMNLYWSKFSNAKNNVELIMIYDIYNDGSIANLGAFDDGVWPIAGIYEEGFSLPMYYYYEPEEDIPDRHADAAIEAAAATGLLTEAVKPIESKEEEAPETTVKTEITASKDVNNGLIVIDYDPTQVKLSVEAVPELSSVNELEDGHILLAFADSAVIAKGTVLANLEAELIEGVTGSVIYVEYKDGCGEADFETIVIGEATPEQPEKIEVTNIEWNWNEDHTAAEAAITTAAGTETFDAEVVIKKTTTCLIDGYTYYVAVVRFDDTIYTDMYVEEVPATGHHYGEPEWAWEDDFSAAYLHIMCEEICLEEDWWLVFEGELEVVEVEADCENDGYTEITATVDIEEYANMCFQYAQMYYYYGYYEEAQSFLDMYDFYVGLIDILGQSLFVDTVRIPGEPAHHTYEIAWTWAEDYSTASATFTCTACSDEQTVEATVTPDFVDGKYVYTATVEFEGETYTDTVTFAIAGDANGDGVLSGLDIIRLRKYLESYDPNAQEQSVEVFAGADVNGDGKIDGRDLIALRKLLGAQD